MTTTAQKAARAAKKTKAKVTDVLLALVIDRSTSMRGMEAATCDGINLLFKEQREQEGKTYLSMTLFDTDFDVRYVGVDLNEVPDLGTPENPYHLQGMTALYDAVATTILGIDAWLEKHPEFDGQVLFTINTDGGENSSVTYRHNVQAINDLISERTARGWQFVFMGAGTAAWTEGQNFAQSIPITNFRNYDNDSASVLRSYAGASASISNTRATGAAYTADQS